MAVFCCAWQVNIPEFSVALCGNKFETSLFKSIKEDVAIAGSEVALAIRRQMNGICIDQTTTLI